MEDCGDVDGLLDKKKIQPHINIWEIQSAYYFCKAFNIFLSNLLSICRVHDWLYPRP